MDLITAYYVALGSFFFIGIVIGIKIGQNMKK